MEILAGILGGIVSGIGMGGGTILIVLLSMFIGIEQHIAQAINIVFFVPTAIVAILLNIKYKKIRWKVAIPVVIFGIIGAIIGAQISIHLDNLSLKKYFGIFLSLVAIYEIYYLFKEYKNTKKSNNK